MQRIAFATSLLATACLIESEATAQRLLGFNHAGQVYSIDTESAAATLLRTNSNAFYLDSARMPDGRLVTLLREYIRHQNQTIYAYGMDEMAENGSQIQGLLADTLYQAIAPKDDNEVWVLETGALGSRVIHHIARTQTVSSFPYIFMPGTPEGLTVWDGWLYTYSSTHGLLRIDPATGNYVDVDPTTGATANVRFLTARNDGVFFGGADDLYRIDPMTGAETLVGRMGNIDLRAAEFPRGYSTPIGQGCASVGAAPQLTIFGNLQVGSVMQARSPGHAPGQLAWLAIELSAPGATGFLPITDLDPLVGTTGCRLLVRPDVSMAMAVAPTGTLSTSITLPAWTDGWNLGLQYVALEPAPGILSVTNAAWIAVLP